MSEVTTAERLRLTIDGREVEADPGELIINVAERAGVFIPRFCYHPRMKPVGMCRMCLVEVSSPRGPSLQPACFVSVADGQEVTTDSPAARKAQEGVLEFLLINHPLDCPVCDQGGECPLQDQAMSHGPGETRFIEEKRHWSKPIPLGPLTLLDRERCIQCARCTRFAEEIAGEPLIDFFSRGDEIEVAVFPERPFDSYFAGNTIQICPVGALTSAPYRFRSRPWDLEQVESTCTFCAVGCRVAVQSSAGAVVRFIGIDSDPVNQSWLCDRGRYGYEAVNAKERLTAPLAREEGGELSEVSFSEALRRVGDGLSEALSAQGPASIGIIGGARLANEDQYAWSKLARAVLHTDNVDAQLGDGLPPELVSSLPLATIDEACAARAALVLAGELREELPVLHLRLRSAAAHGGLRIVDCSPVASPLSEVAAATVPSPPGEAARLVAALLSDRSPSEEELARYPGLEAGREALAGLAGSDLVVVLGRPSLAESADSVAAAAAEIAVRLPGVRFLPALRRANVRGALDMGLAPGLLPGRVSLSEGREWYLAQWGSLPDAVGLDTRGMLEAASAGALRALVLLGADPLVDFPDSELATRALERVPFLVAVDILPSASALLADVVLPAAGPTERSGTTTNIEGRVTRLAQKVVPPGVARADWVIAVEIAERLGFDLGFEHLEGIWEEIEQVAPSHHGATLEAVYGRGGDDGVVVPLASVPVGAPLVRRPLDPIATPGIESVKTQGAPLFAGAAEVPSGDVEESVEIERADISEEPALSEPSLVQPSGTARPRLVSFDPARWRSPEPSAGEGSSFRLVTRRSLYDMGSLVQASPSLAPLAPVPAARLSPAALESIGGADGRVRLSSERASIVLPVVADPAVPDGLCVLPVNLSPVDEPGWGALLDADAAAHFVRVTREED